MSSDQMPSIVFCSFNQMPPTILCSFILYLIANNMQILKTKESG